MNGYRPRLGGTGVGNQGEAGRGLGKRRPLTYVEIKSGAPKKNTAYRGHTESAAYMRLGRGSIRQTRRRRGNSLFQRENLPLPLGLSNEKGAPRRVKDATRGRNGETFVSVTGKPMQALPLQSRLRKETVRMKRATKRQKLQRTAPFGRFGKAARPRFHNRDSSVCGSRTGWSQHPGRQHFSQKNRLSGFFRSPNSEGWALSK